MVNVETYNEAVPDLVKELIDKKVFETSKRIALCTNSHHKLGAALVKNGLNVFEYHNSKAFMGAILKQKLQFDTVIIRWGDRDTWRALKILPKYTKLLNLYTPLFHTGLDHDLNKRFYIQHVGTAPTCNENGRCNIAWDNRAFIYNFDQH